MAAEAVAVVTLCIAVILLGVMYSGEIFREPFIWNGEIECY